MHVIPRHVDECAHIAKQAMQIFRVFACIFHGSQAARGLAHKFTDCMMAKQAAKYTV